MRIIPVVTKTVPGVDVNGNPVMQTVVEPVEPFPANAIKIVAGPDGYTVYELGDVIP